MDKKTLFSLAGLILALGAVFGAILLFSLYKMGAVNPPDFGIACTEEAKMCPDGSSVGRTGPNCEFEECPPVGAGASCGVGGACPSGYECVDTNPVSREGYENFRCLQVGAPRPICLSGKTLISTPIGDIQVKDLKKGMSVWSLDAEGNTVSVPILLSGKTKVPVGHRVMHFKFENGKELFVSPGHRVADGREARSVSVGDKLSGVKVVSADLVLYGEPYTYDILPESATGEYLANGVVLQSTLKQ